MITAGEVAGYHEDCMVGCGGVDSTYASRKVNLLRQLGFKWVKPEIFSGLTEIQIDNKARDIIHGIIRR